MTVRRLSDTLTEPQKLMVALNVISLEQVRENSGFEILVPGKVGENAPPGAEEREILKDIDPQGLVLGR